MNNELKSKIKNCFNEISDGKIYADFLAFLPDIRRHELPIIKRIFCNYSLNIMLSYPKITEERLCEDGCVREVFVETFDVEVSK
jgi:hypothetical protein